MKRRNFIKNCAALPVVASLSTQAAEPAKPNVIIIFTDDQGYADLSCQDVLKDIRTPHLDALAAEGVRFTDGYITGPQCAPSRAGLLSGRYQQRFGLDSIADNPMPLEEVTIAERLQKAGYRTGMVGKWHLDFSINDQKALRENPGSVVKDPDAPLGRRLTTEAYRKYSPGAQGFDEFYKNVDWWQGHYRWANYRADGSSLNPEGEWLEETTGDRLEDETAGALAFIKRNHKNPFFLYLAYSGPHTPLAARKEQLEKFPGEMPERRRYALAMMATMDDGVGEIVKLLKKHGQYENTLFCFASDNGAVLKMTMPDTKPPTAKRGWDGSRNDPMNGEKGMLAEGGIRVPFFMTWKNRIPSGKIYSRPAISLDFTATALAAAGQPLDNLDGVDLAPYLNGTRKGDPHDFICWRFWNQSAIRAGDWKLLRLGDKREYLFNLKTDKEEQHNLIAKHPEMAGELREKLTGWAKEMKPARLPAGKGNGAELQWYSYYMKEEETE